MTKCTNKLPSCQKEPISITKGENLLVIAAAPVVDDSWRPLIAP